MRYAQQVAQRLREGIPPRPLIEPTEKKAGHLLIFSTRTERV